MQRETRRHAKMAKHSTRAILLGLGLALAGCKTQVSNTTASYAPAAPPVTALAQPSRVLVQDFSAAPNIVQLDTSPGVQLQRSSAGISPQQAAQQDIADVQNSMANTLVEKIQAMGLAAQRVPPGTQPGADDLLLAGRFTAIQEGSRARRLVVGLGAGKSVVTGSAVLLRGGAGGPQILQSFDLASNSGHMPGMGVGAAATGASAAATALSGGAHAVGEANSTPVQDRAIAIANHLADSLKQYFQAQHWIAPAAAP